MHFSKVCAYIWNAKVTSAHTFEGKIVTTNDNLANKQNVQLQTTTEKQLY